MVLLIAVQVIIPLLMQVSRYHQHTDKQVQNKQGQKEYKLIGYFPPLAFMCSPPRSVF